ncbi:glycoside hydrolase family 2 TIM barrel-domain containing protein [Fibrisoma limi]|uniref:glycoside hydrolase family 2 TIM barrel-domain containing protein n=1 Tax=Fibrisoma limi TaxID=663275 RepID=UPI001E2DFDD3|nr:glycoside hydrolase family 2 TIM barrel-domain containing protein [Fibrisoma limi]
MKPTAIYHDGQSYQLLRYGKPYFIKGAGGVSYLEELKARGGNSVRIWDDLEAGPILDKAQSLGLTVLFGIWVEREMEGFDYHNQVAVDQQYALIRKIVLKYRNHPALLMWCVGNEWAMEADNFRVYDEVNRIASLIHELDPDHPVTTVISPDNARAIWLVRKRCPAIDVLAFNSYALTEKLSQFLQDGGWTKPYLISEYGAQAYWETPMTPWQDPIEPTSQQKYEYVHRIYRQYIGSRPPNCLGSYLFYWDFKQEETHTWFNVYDQEGRSTSLADLMQYFWTGKQPPNQAPTMQRLLVDGRPILYQSYSSASGLHRAQVLTTDPEGDSLTYHWEIKRRAKNSADYVGTPLPALEGLITSSTGPSITFRLPTKPGSYRLFAHAYDTHRHVATANFVFEVTAKQ